MRSIVTALVIIALLAIWVITQYPGDPGSGELLTGRDSAPVTVPRESGLPIADRRVFPETTPDEVVADTESNPGTIDESAFNDPAMQTLVIDFDSGQRVSIVDYLSRSGLAMVDAERIADSALDGARECVAYAFGTNGEISTGIETCMFNVLAAHGLTAIAVSD